MSHGTQDIASHRRVCDITEITPIVTAAVSVVTSAHGCSINPCPPCSISISYLPALHHIKGCIEAGAHHTKASANHQLPGCIGGVALHMRQTDL